MNMILVRFGGVCAILSILATFVGLATQGFLMFFVPVLGIGAGLGFHQALRGPRPLTFGAVVAFVTGLLVLTAVHLIWAFNVDWIVVSEPDIPLVWTASWYIGNVVTGIGVALFSLVNYRTSVVAKWVGGVGLVIAVLGIFGGVAVFSIWLFIMGVALLRLRQPGSSDVSR